VTSGSVKVAVTFSTHIQTVTAVPNLSARIIRAARALTFIVVITASWACDDSTGPESGPLAGRWRSPASVSYDGVTFTLRHEESLLIGEGTLEKTPPERALVIGQTSPGNNVHLTFSAENTIPALFLGTVSADGGAMTGTIWTQQSGAPASTITIQRQ